MNKRTRLTNIQKQELADQIRQGVDKQALLDLYHISNNTYCDILNKYGIREEQAKIPDHILEKFPFKIKVLFQNNRKNLNSLDDFVTWAKRKVSQYKLIRGVDFQVIDLYDQSSGRGGKNLKEYFATEESSNKISQGLSLYEQKQRANIVYFILGKTTNLIKIGVTVDLKERMQTLQLSSPDKLQVVETFVAMDALKVESYLHKQFKHLLSHGEWFSYTDEIKQHITKWKKESQKSSEEKLSMTKL
jgi:hypothetical protein